MSAGTNGTRKERKGTKKNTVKNETLRLYGTEVLLPMFPRFVSDAFWELSMKRSGPNDFL